MPIGNAKIVESITRALNDADLFERNGMVPDAWQKSLLSLRGLSGEFSQRICVNVTRQGGKGECAASIAATHAALNENQTVAFVSPAQRQSDINLRKCVALIKGAGYSHEILKASKDEIHFRNGSVIYGLPAGRPQNIRGFSLDGLIVDEASQVDDETFSAIMPMTATRPNAFVILLSTPAGARGFFYRTFKDTENGWVKIRVPASEIPRISTEFLEQQKRELGPAMYVQEYCCSFLEDEFSLISPETIARVFQPMGTLHAA